MGITTATVSCLILLATTSTATNGQTHSVQEYQNLQRSVNISSTEVDLSLRNIPILSAEYLEEFAKVTRLSLKNCKIQEIEYNAFRTMENLVELDLSNNFLDHLPDNLFEHNKLLERVSLRNNKFTAVPYIAVPLRKLDLSRCHISALNFTEHLEVQSLDLGHNKLETLSSKDMTILNKVFTINLNNNRWKCGSKFDEVLCWSLSRMNNTISERMPIKCSTIQGNLISYTILHRQEFCEIPALNTDSPLTKAVTSRPTLLLDSVTSNSYPSTSVNSAVQTSLPETSSEPTTPDIDSTTRSSNKPIPDHSTTYKFVDPISQTPFTESSKSISDQSIPEGRDSDSENSNESKSDQLTKSKDINSGTEKYFPENRNNPKLDQLAITENIDSDSEKSLQENSIEPKLDKSTMFEDVDSFSENSNRQNTYRKSNMVSKEQERVILWVVVAFIGWMLAAFTIALLIYMCTTIYFRKPYNKINNIIS